MAELNIKEPEHKFYSVVVEVDTQEGEKVKKMKENHLVDGVNPTDVETKVAQMMDGTMWEWRIVSMSISKISVVY